MDRGAWWAAVHGDTKSWTWLSDLTFTFHFHALEKEMAAHSSVLAWRIPGTGEPGGLPSTGSHRVGHDWSDLAAAAHSYNALGCHYDEVIFWLSEHQRRAFRKTGYYEERKKDMNKRELFDEQQRLALIHEIWAWRVPLKNVKQKFNQANLVIQLALCSCSWITASHLLIVIKIVNGKY